MFKPGDLIISLIDVDNHPSRFSWVVKGGVYRVGTVGLGGEIALETDPKPGNWNPQDFTYFENLSRLEKLIYGVTDE